MVPGPSRKPGANLFVFVGRTVVHHQVNIQLLGRVRINVAKELQKLLMAMAYLGFSKNTPSSNVQSSKQSQGPMANIIMSVALGITKTQGKGRLGAFKRLALAFLIDTQHQSTFRRVQIQPQQYREPFPQKTDRWKV